MPINVNIDNLSKAMDKGWVNIPSIGQKAIDKMFVNVDGVAKEGYTSFEMIAWLLASVGGAVGAYKADTQTGVLSNMTSASNYIIVDREGVVYDVSSSPHPAYFEPDNLHYWSRYSATLIKRCPIGSQTLDKTISVNGYPIGDVRLSTDGTKYFVLVNTDPSSVAIINSTTLAFMGSITIAGFSTPATLGKFFSNIEGRLFIASYNKLVEINANTGALISINTLPSGTLAISTTAQKVATSTPDGYIFYITGSSGNSNRQIIGVHVDNPTVIAITINLGSTAVSTDPNYSSGLCADGEGVIFVDLTTAYRIVKYNSTGLKWQTSFDNTAKYSLVDNQF